ncbi:hypothetical protein LO772_33225 [Yinghuangia sp. ASG 101]|nr:hypothetical protein [Yinghuangia sp. ASG 101]UGQ11584.1 hypothetical protein LO772_33225 [Yinghuangia sp. ASG 101]
MITSCTRSRAASFVSSQAHAGFAQAWAVLGVWAAVACAVAVAAVHRRDV